MRFSILIAAAALGLASTAALPTAAFAAQAPVYTGLIGNVAVSGYDPVAYFSQNKPVKGNSKFSTTYQGAEFRFASAQNLATFKANPAKYSPQYGGYCAWAVSQGYTAPGDANVWKIVDGKLYLNYNKEVGERWSKNIPGFIAAATKNWPTVLEK